MPYSRRLPRIAPNGRIALWLSPTQRDLFIGSPEIPQDLGHALHRAPVRKGKLTLRVTRDSLDALIRAAAGFTAQGRGDERALATLLRYLQSLEGRFDDGPADEAPDG